MLISFIQPQAATNPYYFYFMQMVIGSWVLRSLHSPKFSSQMFALKKINTTSCCQSRLYTAPETFVRHKKNRIKFDFLRFHIHNKHFDTGKDDEYGKKRKNAFQNVGLSMQRPLNSINSKSRVVPTNLIMFLGSFWSLAVHPFLLHEKELDILLLSSSEKKKTWGWINDVKIYIFGKPIPLPHSSVDERFI